MEMHSIALEQSVLVSLMMINDAYDAVGSKLHKDLFVSPQHHEVFKAIVALKDADSVCDATLVADWLASRNLLDKAGGEKYLMKMLNDSPATLYNFEAYVDRLQSLNIKRKSADALKLAMDQINNNPNADALSTVNSVVDGLLNATMHIDSGKMQSISDGLKLIISDLENNLGQGAGCKTGFTDLDRLTGGFEQTDLIVVAARPSMGKTAFAVNLVERIQNQNNHTAVVFSLEMDLKSITRRIIASNSRVALNSLRDRNLNEYDWQKISVAMSKLQNRNLVINDKSGLNIGEIRTQANKAKRQHGVLSCVMIDYLQIMGGIDPNNKVNSIGEVTRQLKGMAKDLGCPVILLSQLNRDVDSRKDTKPVLSDLRDSGAIEQDADIVLFLHRDEYYTKQKSKFKGLAEVIVGKHRNGATGSVYLGFEGQYSAFVDCQQPSFGEGA